MTDREGGGPVELEAEDAPIVLEAPPVTRKALTVAEQFHRNAKIIEARVRNRPWASIAQEHGLTVRRCELIFAEWRATNPSLRDHDPVEIIDELLLGYQAILVDLERVAKKADNDSAVVGALNSKMRAYREIGELLQAIGVLPNDLGTMHLHIDGRVTAERIVTVMERFDLPEAVFDAVLDALGGAPDSLPEQTA